MSSPLLKPSWLGASSMDISGMPSSCSCLKPRSAGTVRHVAPAGGDHVDSSSFCERFFLLERRNSNVATTSASTPTAMPMESAAPLPPPSPSLVALAAPLVFVSEAPEFCDSVVGVSVAFVSVEGVSVKGVEACASLEEEEDALRDAEADADADADEVAEDGADVAESVESLVVVEVDVEGELVVDVTELSRLLTRSSVDTVDTSATVLMAACFPSFPAYLLGRRPVCSTIAALRLGRQIGLPALIANDAKWLERKESAPRQGASTGSLPIERGKLASPQVGVYWDPAFSAVIKSDFLSDIAEWTTDIDNIMATLVQCSCQVQPQTGLQSYLQRSPRLLNSPKPIARACSQSAMHEELEADRTDTLRLRDAGRLAKRQRPASGKEGALRTHMALAPRLATNQRRGEAGSALWCRDHAPERARSTSPETVTRPS